MIPTEPSDEAEASALRAVARQSAGPIEQARLRAEADLGLAREALRANEARLSAIFNQAAVGIAVATLDGHLRDMNRKFCDILGYTVEELRALTVADITDPEDLPATRAAIAGLLDGTTADYRIEKRYRHKNGSTLWSLTTVTLLKDAAGRPQQFLGVIEDITAKKDAESELRDERRMLAVLNDTGRALASQLTVAPLVHTATDAATQLSGAEFGAFFYNDIDTDRTDLLVDTLSGAAQNAFAAFEQPRSTALMVATFLGGAPIRCDDLLADANYGTMVPQTRTQGGQRALRSYLAVPVPSRTGAVIGGLFLGHSKPGVFTDRSEQFVVGVAAQAGVALDNARLYDAAQTAAQERQALLESERAARTAAERLSDVKDTFLATLSHELRTPLNAILGWAQLLRTSAPREPDYTKGLETIERNARVQTKLIEDLLDMSRITSGKLRLEVQPLQPVAFVEAAIETVRPAADAKGLRLETRLDPAAGLVSGDPGRLQQVIWNVLSNAIKFTPRGGTVRVVLERVESHVEVTVTDSGIGIHPTLIPALFERFRQGDASTTRKYGGLGLGLSIAKSLVELHGGTIVVNSDGEDTGTIVTVRLPLSVITRTPDRDSRPRHTNAGAQQTPPFIADELAGQRVLVVDDQADARELIRRVLEGAGAEVFTAGAATEALAMLAEHHPTVLVSDIGMPDADGFELLRRIRALPPDRGGCVRAIALTAFARSEDRTRALRAGFLVHVAKPVDPSELVATVASVARRADFKA